MRENFFVNQIDDDTCVHACLSMVTGNPIRDVIDFAGKNPLSFGDEVRYLTSCMIYADTRYQSGVLPNGRLYLATAPSLNFTGGLHRVLIDVVEGDIRVYDPQYGRADRIAYGMPGQILHDAQARCLFEFVYMNFDILEPLR